MRERARRRPRVGRVIIVVPSLFTLANLFFGIWSIVLASQGSFYLASWGIVISGVLDMLDGLSARMSKTGTRFGGGRCPRLSRNSGATRLECRPGNEGRASWR